MMNLAERAAATERVIARFRNKPFDWTKAATCIHLLRAQLVAFGYSPPPVTRFRTPLGAKRALRALGHATLETLIDANLPRIPAARMIVGDVAMLPGAAPFNALVIAAGGGKWIGWSEENDGGLSNLFGITGDVFVAAWAIGR